jgi:hypothetical protein
MKNKLFLALALFLSTWGPGCVERASAATGSGNVTDVMQFGGGANTSSNAQMNIAKGSLTAAGGAGEYFFLEYGGVPTDGTCSPFRKNGATYQAVANGILCVEAYYSAAGTWNLMQLFSATASYSNNVTCSSQTSPVYQSGSSGNYVLSSSSTQYAMQVHPILYKFAGSSYPGVQIQNGGAINHLIRLLCKEL